jgi:hypothetical protein
MHSERPIPAFEDVYPKFAFAPLVSLVLGLAEWIRKYRARESEPQAGACGANTQKLQP